MAYQTGTAADNTALRTALTSFAVANGWTWDATYEMLSKGAVFAKLTLPAAGTLRIQGALGYTGATLTTPTANYAEIRDLRTPPAAATKAITWPVTYHLFANAAPDDLVCLINFDTAWWEWLGLGQCTDLGVGAAGKSTWFGASMPNVATSILDITEAGAINQYTGHAPCAPFWAATAGQGYGNSCSAFLHCALDGSDGVVRAWSNDDLSNHLIGQFYRGHTPLLARQPNAWNSETLLVPARIVVDRPSGFYSYAAEMPHARLLRVNNYEGGNLITLGADTWFVAPFFKKNTAAQNPDDSGTWGWAIRKTP